MLARRTLTDKFWQGPWHCRLALCNPRSSLLEKEHACCNPFIKRCDLLNISCVACNGKRVGCRGAMLKPLPVYRKIAV